MPNNWTKYKLKDLTTKIGSGSTPRGGDSAYISEGISLIRSQNILDYTFSYGGLAHINEQQAKELNGVTIYKDDVLINITGDSVARVSQVPDDVLPARVNQHVAILRANQEILNAKFLKYFLLQPRTKADLLTISSSGATRKAITKVMLEEFNITLPPLPEQQAIAEILSSLDDKIELNMQTNKTLEEIANALYKHWFIDFGPFKDGKFIETELGLIPKGWEVKKLKDLVDVVNGFAFKGSDFIETGVPVLKIKNVKAGKILLSNIAYVSKGSAEKAQKARIYPNDILITMTGNRMDGNPDTWVGKVAMFLRDGEYYLNQRVSKIKIKSDEKISEYYLSQTLSSIEFQNYFITNSTSSGGQANISPDLIYNTLIINAPKVIFEKYEEVASLLFIKMFQNELENDIMAKTRDYLLPKLISGEIQVKDAAKKVKEVL